MKSVFFVLFLFLMPVFQNVNSKIKLEIGFVLSAEDVKELGFPIYEGEGRNRKQKGRVEFIATHPNQLRPFIVRQIEGVRYEIAFDKSSREVKYIHTNDEQFRTVEGLKTGDCMSAREGELHPYPGWELQGEPAKDGWIPVFGFNGMPLGFNGAKFSQTEKKACIVITGFSKGSN